MIQIQHLETAADLQKQFRFPRRSPAVATGCSGSGSSIQAGC